VIVSNGTLDNEPHAYSADDLRHMNLIIGIISPMDKASLEYYGVKAGIKVRSAVTLAQALDAFIIRNAAAPGVIGWKSTAYDCGAAYDAKAADAAIKILVRGGSLTAAGQATLNRFFYEEAYRRLARYNKPVAVHCGVAGDYRTMDVKNFIPMFQKFPDIHFDLFHMSLPSYLDYAWCGRNFANVSLNFCWANLVSPELFERGVEACLDVVPLNKITAFGGDVIFCPPAAVGSLLMAKESLARVLGRRVKAGTLNKQEAHRILTMWFYDNPRRIYGI
jgi:predicted TIM-barrel fold metal-dependent hydrolase